MFLCENNGLLINAFCDVARFTTLDNIIITGIIFFVDCRLTNTFCPQFYIEITEESFRVVPREVANVSMTVSFGISLVC